MNDDNNRLQREKELAFFGTVTASLSHEINNVIAIVGELGGLLDDLLYAAEQGRPLNTDKLKDVSNKMAKQVEKGKIIIKRLNRFAHSVDEPIKQVDVKELLQQISAIAERFAFLKGVSLETDFGIDDSINIQTNPFLLQQAIFLCIQLALSRAQKNDVIKIGYRRQESGVNILFSGFPVAEPDEQFFSILLKELGGNLDIASAQDAGYSLALSIPRAIGGDSSRHITP
jgi:C4-dicarboxylate-specific signal transduction histidine kinase